MTQVMKVTKSHGKKLDSHEHAQTCSGREHASEKNGILAQLGEHLPYKQGVTGSSPVGPTRLSKDNQGSRCGGTGRRAGLKILLWQHSTGSIPVAGIRKASPKEKCPMEMLMCV